MLVAATTARTRANPSCQRFSKMSRAIVLSKLAMPRRRSVVLSLSRRKAHPMLQLIGHKPFHAMANRSVGGDRAGQRSFLLVPHGAFSARRCRLPLGLASRAAHSGAPESIRHAFGAVSADCGFFCPALSALFTRSRRCTLLGNQHCGACLRTDARWLWPPAHILGIPLLGGNSHRAVVADHRGQCIFPASLARHDG